MKLNYSLTGIIALLSFAASAQPDMGLIGHYPLAGNVLNTVGVLGDGIISGNIGTATDRDGNASCAMSFPGTDTDYISVNGTTSDFPPDGAFSVSLWYQGGSANFGDLEVLLSKGTSAFFLALYDLNKPLFGVGWDEAIWAEDSKQWLNNDWHHLVAVYQNGECTFYADTSNKGSMNEVLVNNGEDIIIGRYFEGNLDDIRIYDRALAAAEVQELYLMDGACSGVTSITSGKAATPVNLFPNPATDRLTCQNPGESPVRLALYNSIGRQVLSAEIPGGIRHIPLVDIPAGFYLAEFTRPGYRQTQRLIIGR